MSNVRQWRYTGQPLLEVAAEREFIERPRLSLNRPACREGYDPRLWSREKASTSFSKALELNSEALDICRGCPSRLLCLNYALEWHEYGVWGGVLECERRDAEKNRITGKELIELDRKRRAA